MLIPGGDTDKETRLDLTEEIVVLVGKGNQQKKWTVPKTFLTKTSEFFKKCCNGEWKEASTGKVKLPEADPDAFSAYLQWLYTRDLVATEESKRKDLWASDTTTRVSAARTTFTALAALGAFADMVMDPAFENAVVDEILKAAEATRYFPWPMGSRSVYDSMPGCRNIKRLIVDYYASEVKTRYLVENRASLHEDLLFDVLKRLHEDRKAPGRQGTDRLQPSWEKRCKYHTHNDEVPKCT